MRNLLPAIIATAVLWGGVGLAQPPAPGQKPAGTKPSQPSGNKGSPPFNIEGDIRDTEGKPIGLATVTTAGSRSATTNPAGHYVLRSLPRAGTVYVVRASHKDFTMQPDHTNVSGPPSGDVKNINFTGTRKAGKK